MRLQLCTTAKYSFGAFLVAASLTLINWNTVVTGATINAVPVVVAMVDDLSYNFTYLATPKHICGSSKKSVKLAIVVKSRVESVDYRQAIRDTWGKVAAQYEVPVIFVVATINQSQSELLAESYNYGDILQSDLLDTYHNLSLKMLSLLTWESHFCSDVSYFFHTDDDCIVIIPHLLTYINERFSAGRHSNVLHGHCWIGGTKVARNQSSHKNFMPYSVYPHKWYPSHCSGTGYLISSDVPKKLIRAIPNMTFVKDFGNNEDVLFTGVLAERANIPRIHNQQVLYHNISTLEPCHQHIISSHEYKPAEILRTHWQLLQSSYERCQLKR